MLLNQWHTLPVCWLHARQSRKHAVNTLMPLQEDNQQVAKGGPLRASFMVTADCRSGPPGEDAISTGGPAAATLVRLFGLCS